MRYVDHRKWDSRQFRDMTFSDIAEEKNLMELNDDHDIPNKAALFDELKLTKADSMTILPIFVTMDEQFIPDSPLEYENYEYEYYIDYETESWQNNLAGRPHPGGKWFYHVLVKLSNKIDFCSLTFLVIRFATSPAVPGGDPTHQ